MADTCCEVLWLNLFKTFGYYNITPVQLFCDSKSALYIASNAVFHERTKHIDIDCHLVREKLQLGIISTQHIASTDQPAHQGSCLYTSSQTVVQVGCFQHVPTLQLEGGCYEYRRFSNIKSKSISQCKSNTKIISECSKS